VFLKHVLEADLDSLVQPLLSPVLLGVFSDAMPTSESSGHAVYSAGNSSTSQLMTGQTFNLGYGSGSASGNVHTDVLELGVAISGYPMETALDVSSSFSAQDAISGLWGMSLAVYQVSLRVSLVAGVTRATEPCLISYIFQML
jgi:hypothetical protein